MGLGESRVRRDSVREYPQRYSAGWWRARLRLRPLSVGQQAQPLEEITFRRPLVA